jgi:hypothetical protein
LDLKAWLQGRLVLLQDQKVWLPGRKVGMTVHLVLHQDVQGERLVLND